MEDTAGDVLGTVGIGGRFGIAESLVEGKIGNGQEEQLWEGGFEGKGKWFHEI